MLFLRLIQEIHFLVEYLLHSLYCSLVCRTLSSFVLYFCLKHSYLLLGLSGLLLYGFVQPPNLFLLHHTLSSLLLQLVPQRSDLIFMQVTLSSQLLYVVVVFSLFLLNRIVQFMNVSLVLGCLRLA